MRIGSRHARTSGGYLKDVTFAAGNYVTLLAQSYLIVRTQ